LPPAKCVWVFLQGGDDKRLSSYAPPAQPSHELFPRSICPETTLHRMPSDDGNFIREAFVTFAGQRNIAVWIQ